MAVPLEIHVEGHTGTIASLVDGHVVTFCTEESGRHNLGEERPPLWVYLRFSDDGGRTWSEPQPGFQHPPGPGLPGWNYPLVDGDGRLHVFCLRIFSLDQDGEGWRSHLLHTVTADGGGTSSSLIIAISFGIFLGAISLPASNWRGATFTIFTGAAAAGGGGGGGGGGGATRKLVNCVVGRVSV